MLNEKLSGRGIKIDCDGYVEMGYFKKSESDVGNFIQIHDSDFILVGEKYLATKRLIDDRYIRYFADG